MDYFKGVFTGSVFDLQHSQSFEMERERRKDFRALYEEGLADPEKMRRMVQFGVLFNADFLSFHEFLEAFKALDCGPGPGASEAG